MLTLYYAAATWLQAWRLSTITSRIKEARRKHGSIAIHQEIPPFVYMVRSASMQSKIEVNGVLSKSCSNHNIANIKDLFWYSSNKKALTIYPMQELDVSSWILVMARRTHFPIQLYGTHMMLDFDRIMVLLEADYHTCQFQCDYLKLEIEKYGIPVAWHVRETISILFASDVSKFTSLCLAFMHNNITLENGIQIIRIMSVDAYGSPYRIHNADSVPETYAPIDPGLDFDERKENFMSRWRAHISMLASFTEAVEQVKDSQQKISVRHPGSGVGAVCLGPSGVSVFKTPRDNILEEEGETEVTTIPEEEDEEEANRSCSVSGDNRRPEDGMSIISEGEECSSVAANQPTVPLEPSTPSSTHDDSFSRISTDTVVPPDSTRVSGDFSMATSFSSLKSLPSTPRRTTLSSPALTSASTKPPNIVVFSDSSSASDSLRAALDVTLVKDKYTVHTLPCSGLASEGWSSEARLVVLHGDVPPHLSSHLLRYLTTAQYASLFCLCSDLLGVILPLFRTAEVRPNELVRCSYKTWKHVPLVHHVFCYQPSPPAQQFSQDDHNSVVIPPSVEMVDDSGKKHKLKIEVLGVEDTWKTPSLLLVTFPETNSKIIFSQVHLELEPGMYSCDEDRRLTLEQSNKARLEILQDVLSNHFNLACSLKQSATKFTHAYFLGNHEKKQALLSDLSEKGILDSNDVVSCSNNLSLKFCGKGITPPPPTASLLPVLMHSCPQTFSTVEYYENLKSDFLGRLVIFCEVMTSSMNVVRGMSLNHGLTIIPLYQTQGKGRGGNTWLSPQGCAMFTVQLHVPLSSQLGQTLSILQHITSLAIVSAICQIQGLQELDIGLKWPNDIYANKTTKIGGVIAESLISGNTAICNLGCGFNLNNKEPTLCLNDMVKGLNQLTGANVPPFSHEKYFAIVFNKLEELFNMAQSGQMEEIFRLYYNYWLHGDAEVKVKDGEETKDLVIKGINKYGFLMAEGPSGELITIESDGNSFDMMKGLIIPKLSK